MSSCLLPASPASPGLHLLLPSPTLRCRCRADLVQETVQVCGKNESWPGLWEVPTWRLTNETAGERPYAMDPG